MGRGKGSGKDSRLDALGQRIERWRAAGRPGKRMPEDLWGEAVEMAGTTSSYRVSRELGLNYESLRERVGETRLAMAVEEAGSEAEPSFAELDVSAVLGAATDIEVERVDGTRMRIRMSGGGAEIAPLLAAFVQVRAAT